MRLSTYNTTGNGHACTHIIDRQAYLKILKLFGVNQTKLHEWTNHEFEEISMFTWSKFKNFSVC